MKSRLRKFCAIATIIAIYVLFVHAPSNRLSRLRVQKNTFTVNGQDASRDNKYAGFFSPLFGLDVIGNDDEAATAAVSFTHKLIPKYKDELKLLVKNGFKHAAKARATGLSMNPPIICKGQIGTVEMSFLYM